MGEARTEALRVCFDSRIKLEFHDASITSDAGLVARRESPLRGEKSPKSGRRDGGEAL